MKKTISLVLCLVLLSTMVLAFSLNMTISYTGKTNEVTYGETKTEWFNIYNYNDFDLKITSYVAEGGLPERYIKIDREDKEFYLKPNEIRKVIITYKIPKNSKLSGYYQTPICFTHEPQIEQDGTITIVGELCGKLRVNIISETKQSKRDKR